MTEDNVYFSEEDTGRQMLEAAAMRGAALLLGHNQNCNQMSQSET